ncbi:MAG: hypothetical protein AAGB48_05575 [Planctomycetota bacterium]
MMLRALLGELRLRSLDDGVGVIACPTAVRGVAVMKLDDLGRLASTLTGSPVRFELVEIAGDAPEQQEPRGASGGTPTDHEAAVAPHDAADHPVVRQAIDVFGARIVEVKPIPNDRPQD